MADLYSSVQIDMQLALVHFVGKNENLLIPIASPFRLLGAANPVPPNRKEPQNPTSFTMEELGQYKMSVLLLAQACLVF